MAIRRFRRKASARPGGSSLRIPPSRERQEDEPHLDRGPGREPTAAEQLAEKTANEAKYALESDPAKTTGRRARLRKRARSTSGVSAPGTDNGKQHEENEQRTSVPIVATESSPVLAAVECQDAKTSARWMDDAGARRCGVRGIVTRVRDVAENEEESGQQREYDQEHATPDPVFGGTYRRQQGTRRAQWRQSEHEPDGTAWRARRVPETPGSDTERSARPDAVHDAREIKPSVGSGAADRGRMRPGRVR